MDKFASQFFSGKSIGKSLKEVAVDAVKTDIEDVITRWYHAPRADLFTWTDHRNNIIKQQLHFNGQVVEWNCLEGIKTGLIVEADLGLKPNYTAEGKLEPAKVAESIKYDKNVMNNCVELAVEILEHVPVEDPIRDQLVSNFKDPHYLTNMSPEAFVLRFGQALKGARKDPSFLNSFIKSFKKLVK